jgi:hypothetical protein
VFSLSRQIQHKQQLLSDLLSKRLPTLVLAHSIGSYMVLQALHQLQQAGGQHLQYLHKVCSSWAAACIPWQTQQQGRWCGQQQWLHAMYIQRLPVVEGARIACVPQLHDNSDKPFQAPTTLSPQSKLSAVATS